MYTRRHFGAQCPSVFYRATIGNSWWIGTGACKKLQARFQSPASIRNAWRRIIYERGNRYIYIHNCRINADEPINAIFLDMQRAAQSRNRPLLSVAIVPP